METGWRTAGVIYLWRLAGLALSSFCMSVIVLLPRTIAMINHVANDDEACSAPVELTQIQNRLFQ